MTINSCSSLIYRANLTPQNLIPSHTVETTCSTHTITSAKYEEERRDSVQPMEVRDHFTSLEQSWSRLAAEIESGQRLLDLIGEISRDLVPLPKPPSSFV